MRRNTSQQYSWFLLDKDLGTGAAGKVDRPTLAQALVDVESELSHIDAEHYSESRAPYSLMIFRDQKVVAVRPPTVGIC